MHGFFVATIFGVGLGEKTRSLVFSVVELTKTVAKLAAGDVKLKTLGHFRPCVVGACQGGYLGWVLHDEGRLPELVFHRLFKIGDLQAGQRAEIELVFCAVFAQFFQLSQQPGSVVHMCTGAGVFDDGFTYGQALEGLAQVHRLALVGQLRAAADLLRYVADQLFGVSHQVFVVPPCSVKLHHRELRVVPNADAFVAKAAVDLKHALKTADDQTFEVKLGRDAQKHLLVQRVVVRHKRFGIGAARNRVQHRRFHLQEVVVNHEAAHAGHRLAAVGKTLARRCVGDQVHITLAVLDLLVGDAVKFVGQRAQAFGDQANAGGVNRQLTSFGFEQGAGSGHDVAQVPVLEGVVHVFTDTFVVDVDLDAPARGAK